MESLDLWTVCIGALAFVGLSALLLRPLEAKPRRAGYRTYPRSVPRSVTTLEEPTARSNFTADQLKAVMAADYFPKRILSATEARVMYAAEDAVREAGLRWRIMAQVALGEVLRSESLAAFHAINAKRVDLLVVCEKGCHWPQSNIRAAATISATTRSRATRSSARRYARRV